MEAGCLCRCLGFRSVSLTVVSPFLSVVPLWPESGGAGNTAGHAWPEGAWVKEVRQIIRAPRSLVGILRQK